jgi:tetratricopeptide (TPR) repeat protein
MYLSNLGAALQARFEHAGRDADLDAAIDHYQQAVTALPDLHPHGARYLSNLGGALQIRFRSTGRKIDRDAAIGCQREAAGIVSALPIDRLRAAESWGRGAFYAGDNDAGADGYAAAVELLPQVAWHGQDQRTREEHLAGWTGLAADAAACAVSAGQHRRAVELLEAGRSLIWTQELHLRSDLGRLAERAPGLAAELEHARTDLDLPLPLLAPGAMDGDPPALDDLTSAGTIQREALERRHQAARRWDEVLAQVRRLAGFEHFLKPIPVAELRAAAAGGPVVIVNASQLGCHALIVTATGDPCVEVIPLPGLTRSDAINQANMLLTVISPASDLSVPLLDREADHRAAFDVLDWLWRVVAEPVLNALGHTGPPATGTKWPRIWWCPTGPLTLLPLHAAGHYPVAAEMSASSSQTVPARVISSYTPTLAALQRAREASVVASDTIRQLAIGMPTTPGQEALPKVRHELRVLAKYFPPPRQGRQLLGQDATCAAVLDALPDYPWVHLACHAYQQSTDPSDSAFALHDGPLTLASLSALHLDHAELAFLSACQTATGDLRLPDEAIHLAAAMQLLGYRHVIATMWTIADKTAPRIADIIYSHLTTTGHPDPADAAHALHQAVSTLRTDHPDQPLLWGPYIHIGP